MYRHVEKPVLQRRHFEFIARTIKSINVPGTESDLAYLAVIDAIRAKLAEAFASELAATNPKFDQTRFIKACGVVS